MRRHNPAKQNQFSPASVNFHFVFGDLVPVNSKSAMPAPGSDPPEIGDPPSGN
jgi:hypothetical protein